MDTLLRDIRHAARGLRKAPAFTAAAVLCLALGIGANSALFSVINAVLLTPLGYAEPERLVMVWERREDSERNVVSPGNYRDWVAQAQSFERMAAVFSRRVNLTGRDEPEELAAQFVTQNFFPTLGVQPLLGRAFTSAEDVRGGPPVVMLSEALWRRLFAGDRGVLGTSVTINGVPLTVVGVMPATFGFGGERTDVWLPFRLDPAVDYRAVAGRYIQVVGRLAPGVPLDRAQGEMTTVARRLAESYPRFNTGWGANVVPLREQVVGAARRPLVVLFGVVAFVLLIACANVAILQLARAAAREREVAVRAALGAGRGRVVRFLLTESTLLAVAGGALGLLLAWLAVRALVVAAPDALPRVREVTLDGRVVLFTSAVALLTGVLFGIVPALQAARADLQDALKAGSRGSTRSGRARGVLAATQVALSLVLLVGAGLLVKSMIRLQRVEPGFEADRALTMRIALPFRKYDSQEKQTRFFEQLLARARSVPGVQAATAINWLPLSGMGSATGYVVAGRPFPRPGEEPGADVRVIDPSYFRVMRIPVIKGQPFTEQDRAGGPTKVVISQSLAREQFPGEDPIGRRILMEWGDTLNAEIVAVVGDVRHRGLDSLPEPTLYWAMAQFPSASPWMSLVTRSTGDPAALAPALRAEVRAIDPEQPVADVKSFATYLGESVARRRFSTTFLGVFAALALVLSAIGIYGVIAFSVAQRTREIGVRMALGARATDVLRQVVTQGMRVTIAGIVAGLLGALFVTRALGTLLYEVSPTDALTYVATTVTLAAVAFAATLVPARRATRVDPMVALRSE